MKTREARRTLADLTQSQWGLVTSRQALARGVSHMQMSRFAEAGDLHRLSHGVYRDAGAPESELEDLRAAWLSTEPDRLAHERLGDPVPGVIVSLSSAANLHRIGDFRAREVTFTTPTRRQTQRQAIRYRTRALPASDVAIVNGLPVTTRERTIADLLETREDLSTVADAYRDASLQSSLDQDRLQELLAPLAHRNGLPKGDGAALLQRFDQMAGIDLASLARQVTASSELTARVLAEVLPHIPRPDLEQLAALSIPIPQNPLKEQAALLNRILQPTLAKAVWTANRPRPEET